MFKFGDAVKLNPHSNTTEDFLHGRRYVIIDVRQGERWLEVKVVKAWHVGTNLWQSDWLPAGMFVRVPKLKPKVKRSKRVWNKPGEAI